MIDKSIDVVTALRGCAREDCSPPIDFLGDVADEIEAMRRDIVRVASCTDAELFSVASDIADRYTHWGKILSEKPIEDRLPEYLDRKVVMSYPVEILLRAADNHVVMEKEGTEFSNLVLPLPDDLAADIQNAADEITKLRGQVAKANEMGCYPAAGAV